MTTTIILSPGYENSNEQHWQSHLERKYKNVIRVPQKNWFNPERKIWIEALAKTIESTEGKALLVGHSCGCNAITQWAEQTSNSEKVIAAILVAPADVDAPNAIAPIHAQRPVAKKTLPFSSTLICSDNDVHASLERSQFFAKQWKSELIILNKAGHINADTGFGDWPLIEKLIETAIGEPLVLKAT